MKNLTKINSWCKWIFGIATSVIGSFVYDILRGKPILSTFIDITKSIWEFTIDLLSYDLKVWWLLIIVALIILIIYLTHYFNTQDSQEPKFINYREDRFKNWRWTWNWKLNERNNKWSVVDLTPYCPKCGTTLLDNSTVFESTYECPNCDFNTGRYNQLPENVRHIEALIIDKAKRI
jgi:hypothetical protein